MTTSIHPDISASLCLSKRIVIFTGAGLSAESGIPTFRETGNGLWANVDPMAVASIAGFERNPDKVWAWHEDMRRLFAGAKPNAGHEGIALLEMLLQPARVQVITQNIDGFHQEAGSSWVLEIHGSTRRIRCHHQCGYMTTWDDEAKRQCPVCGGPTRPDVVWFGEMLDEVCFELAQAAAETADVFISVGTSGVVQPAASLATLAANSGALTIEVNPEETPFSAFADFSLRLGASDFFQEISETIRAKRLRQAR